MHRFGSHPNHENRAIYEGPPSQGLSDSLRAGSFFEFIHRFAAQKTPLGVIAFIVSDGSSTNNSCIKTEYYDFTRKYSKNLNIHGGSTPGALASPIILYFLKRYYVIVDINAGAVWGDRHCPILYLTCFLFHFLIKGIPKS